MIRFQKQESPEHKFVVASDTICEGWICCKDENGDIVLFTREEAEEDIQELKEAFGDDDSFIVPMEEYIHHRRVFWPTGVVGEIPENNS